MKTRDYIRVPGCQNCTVRPQSARAVVDPYIGIVKYCRKVPLAATDPDVGCWLAEARRLETALPARPAERILGVGIAVDDELARTAAIGEALERYACGIYEPRSVVSATWTELVRKGYVAVEPNRVAPCSVSQLDQLRGTPTAALQPRLFDEHTRTGWIGAVVQGSGETILVPAPLAFFPYRYLRNEPFWTECTTNGLAVAADRDTAVLVALLEVIERDAAALAWLVRRRWPRLRLAAMPKLEQLWRERLSCPDITLHVVDLSSDIAVPVIGAVLEHKRGGVSLGMAARPDAQEAAVKATLEAHLARLSWKKDLELGPRRTFAPDFVDVREPQDHAMLAADPVHGERVLARLTEGDRPTPSCSLIGTAGSAADAVDALTRHLARLGKSVLVVDLTSVDVADAGYHLVRVLVPDLVPLSGSHPLRPLGLKRCTEAAQLAHHSPLDGGSVFEHTPHPFA